jgi:glucosamine--fructose-6-phosphate aminotransferase (isomerizing)
VSTHLLREIHEQPQVLTALLEREAPTVARLAAAIRQRDLPVAMLVARGTSDNAAVYGKYVLESLARLPVALAAPSLYTLYDRPPHLDRALVIGISQSGQSPDLVAVLEEARRQGGLTVAVVNERSSPLAESADHVLWCGAGAERAVAASKSYTAQLLLLAMLAGALGHAPAFSAALSGVPAAVESALALDERLQRLATRWQQMDRCVVLARGYAYATALETALKIKETSYVVADAYSGADFLHGPIAVVDPDLPVLLFGAAGPTIPVLEELTVTLRDRGAALAAVTDDPALASLVDVPLLLRPGGEEALSPISQAVAGQLLAYHLAVAKGYDPDQPRGLRKVTSTR